MPLVNHVHPDAISIFIAGCAWLFWSAFFSALSKWGLARNADSTMWQALAAIQ